MQAKGFFASLFDYSFSAFITPRIIKLLYILSTIVVGLWTLFGILWAFKQSTGFGIVTLVLLGPIFFMITMIYTRVWLELLIVFFRIQGDVYEINQRGGGSSPAELVSPEPEPIPASGGLVPVQAPLTPAPEARFCGSCGTEQDLDKRFCTRCGSAVE